MASVCTRRACVGVVCIVVVGFFLSKQVVIPFGGEEGECRFLSQNGTHFLRAVVFDAFPNDFGEGCTRLILCF